MLSSLALLFPSSQSNSTNTPAPVPSEPSTHLPPACGMEAVEHDNKGQDSEVVECGVRGLAGEEEGISGASGEFEGDRRVVMTMSLSSRCLLYTSPSPRDRTRSRMPSSA
eukprot:TRINITY_DN9358_c0_g1_i1.p1 TRINITY_DN9358_c0_g1~~TRINITY_DN9358_c0_g1_i1.p1  ORF type:complete len:110 (-),score=32.99 TRINITY_DN9358_c0_g1_i1:142-471(-)